MRVAEIIADLKKRFPRSPIEAWEDTYYDTLRAFEGAALGAAFREIMGEWAEPGPPKPAHIMAAIRIEKSDKPKPAWIAKDEQRAARQKRLLETWTAELGEWLKIADAEGWGGHLRLHLGALSFAVAQREVDDGEGIGAALAWANMRDRRPGYPLRHPEQIFDADDAAIFRSHLRSQQKFSGLKRGDKEPPWRLTPAKEKTVRDEIAERLAQQRDATREKLTGLHREQQGDKVKA